MFNYGKRRHELIEQIEERAFLAFNLEGSDQVTVTYLTGFTGEGALLVSKTETVLLTDSRYTEQAKRQIPDLAVEEVEGKYLDAIINAITERELSSLAISSNRTTHYVARRLEQQADADLIAHRDLVAKLRLIKDEHEISAIKEAVTLTEEALTEWIHHIQEGMSERDLSLELEFIMRRNGADSTAFDLIIAAGDNSALPHYSPSTNTLQKGDLLLCDIGVKLNGYCSDMTRVFSIGKPLKKARQIYDTVLSANRAGISAIKPGASCKEVDTRARSIISDAGYGKHFGHGLGHGVGMEVHELPRLSSISEDVLQAGMVVTVEPGIYLPGFGGVRIEDLVVVTEDGCEQLTSFPRTLKQVG